MMNVPVVVRLGGRAGESERRGRNQRPGGKTDSTAELQNPLVRHAMNTPRLYARNRPRQLLNTHT